MLKLKLFISDNEVDNSEENKDPSVFEVEDETDNHSQEFEGIHVLCIILLHRLYIVHGRNFGGYDPHNNCI